MTNLKPFDVERALAGYPVVSKNGKKVIDILLSKIKNIRYPLSVIFEDELTRAFPYDLNGNSISIKPDRDECKLFMDPKNKKVYLYVFKIKDNDTHQSTIAFTSLERAKSFFETRELTSNWQLVEVELEDVEEEPIKPPIKKTNKLWGCC